MHLKSLDLTRRKGGTAIALSGLAVLLLGTISPAAATSSPAPKPSGYAIVHSAVQTSANGTQTSADVACPTNTLGPVVALGGGATIASRSLGVTINSSYPDYNGSWKVTINNTSGADTTFTVYAVCALNLNPLTYGSVITIPPGTQAEAYTQCPTGTVLLGGGAQTSPGDTSASINEMVPFFGPAGSGTSGYSWDTYINNAGTNSPRATAWSDCMDASYVPPGVTMAVGTPTLAPSGAVTTSTVSCPKVNRIQTSVLTGGEGNGSFSTAVNLAASYPVSSTKWATALTNSSGSSTDVTTYAICAY